jgi:xylulokinase
MVTAGIDMGTQSIKVVLYDCKEKRVAAQAQEPLETIAHNDGTREQKTHWYVQALEACFARFEQKDKALIRAIGISGHQHGLVPLDEALF